MCIVQLRETKKCILNLPLAIFFFYPRSGHCKVSITVGRLPRITCQAYFSLHPITLSKMLDKLMLVRCWRVSHTFNLLCSAVNCCLNVLMIACRVRWQSGIFIPFVAWPAMFIMFRNDVCSKACIGCDFHEK